MSRDIIFIGGIDWYGEYKYPIHHIAEKLAVNNRVFYIDNFGGRRDLRPGDVSRISRRFRVSIKKRLTNRNARVRGNGFKHNYPGVTVVQPVLVPTPRLPGSIGRLNSLLLGRALKKIINEHEIIKPVVWTRLPTDVVWNALRRVHPALLVCQCVDNFSKHPLIPKSVRPRFAKFEQRFVSSADLVFVSASQLFEEMRKLNPNTYFFPNGVDPEQMRGKGEPNKFLESLRRPIVGFAGRLGPWVDFKLLKRCAALKPEWSFVMIGSCAPGTSLEGFNEMPNVFLMGPVDFSSLGDCFRYFDVGIIPYRLTEFTQYTFPSKMAEYFAVGLPVVSTPLPEIEPYSDVVAIVHNVEEMIETIQLVLDEPNKSEKIQRRLDFVKTLSWKTMVSKMEELMDSALREKSGF